MELPVLNELIIPNMMIGLLFLVALASALREEAAGATCPARVPGARR